MGILGRPERRKWRRTGKVHELHCVHRSYRTELYRGGRKAYKGQDIMKGRQEKEIRRVGSVEPARKTL